MTIIDQVKALALEGYGAEDIEVLTKGKITRDEAWGVIRWWSDIYGRKNITRNRDGADRSLGPGERVGSRS